MRATRPNEAGFTLLETVVSAVILVLVAAAASGSVTLATRLLGRTEGISNVEATAMRATQAVMLEVAQTGQPASGSDLAVSVGTSTPRGLKNRLVFRKNLGYDEVTGAVVWSAPVMFEFRYDPGETGNGRDDDGDGLVDEGRLVRKDKDDLGRTRTITVAEGVLDTTSFAVSSSGRVVTISIELGTRLEDGSIRKGRAEEDVLIRN